MNKEKEFYIVPCQKSLTFIYPLIGFTRGGGIKPKKSYLYWSEADYSIDDYNLLVYYETNMDSAFKKYEKEEILTKDNVIACFEVEGGMLYVFDMIAYSKDIAEFLDGSYSKYSDSSKKKIMTYYNGQNDNTVRPGRTAHMGLYPHLYHRVVAEELGEGIQERDLTEVVSKFDIQEEWCHLHIIENKNCECDTKTFYLGNGE